MKFMVTGDYKGVIEAKSFNDAQVIVEEKLKPSWIRKKFLKILRLKHSYNFELRRMEE